MRELLRDLKEILDNSESVKELKAVFKGRKKQAVIVGVLFVSIMLICI